MSFLDYNRRLRVSESYDVIVAGGGFAGVSAAVASARKGAKTLLIEHYGFLGGTATAGGVCGFWATIEGLGDVFTEIMENLKKLNALGGWRGEDEEYLKYHTPGLRFDEEYLKYILQDLVIRNGIDLRLHSRVIDVVKNGDKVEYLVVHGKSGIEALKAEIFIDTTGDGDVAALAGAEFKKGRESDGRVLQMTLTFKMWNTGKKVKAVLPEGCAEYKSPEDLPSFFGAARIDDEKIYCNMTRAIGLDPTKTEDLTKAEILARKQVMSCVYYLQTHGYSTYQLASMATQIGVREGRRITGDYILTEEDIVNGREFPDVIAVGTSQIDFHNIDSYGPTGDRLEKVPSYQIPYRCILVKGIQNMLTAGKCISGDQVAQSSYRMIPTCAALGQAAGTAAALAVKNKVTLREINIKMFQEILRQDGIKFTGIPPFHQDDIPEASVKASVSKKESKKRKDLGSEARYNTENDLSTLLQELYSKKAS